MILRRLALFLFVWLICPSLQIWAAEEMRPSYRFLILVDTSAGMRKMDEILPTVVHDLVLDGVYRRMQPGDAFVIWTFADQVDTSFMPPVVWDPSLARAQAHAIDQRIRQVKYQGKVSLEEAIKAVNRIVKESDDLTVLIVHDGSGVLFGTPFDLQVTSIYRQFHKDMVRNERPFVTGFVVRDKKMVAWAVDAAGGSLGLPLFPRKTLANQEATPANSTTNAAKLSPPKAAADLPTPKKSPPASIIVKGPLKPLPPVTNSPAVKPVTPAPTTQVPSPAKPATQELEPAAPTPDMAPPKPAFAPPPQTKPAAPVVAPPVPAPVKDKPVSVTSKTDSPPPAQPKVEKPAQLPTAADAVPQAKNTGAPAPAAVSTMAPKAVPSPKPVLETRPVASTSLPAASAAAPMEARTNHDNAASTAASKAVGSAAQLAQTAVVVPPAGGPDWIKLGLGFLFLAAAVVSVFFLLRRKQPAAHGSVISRSMNRDHTP